MQLPAQALARLAARGIVLDSASLTVTDARDWQNLGVSARWDRLWNDRLRTELTLAHSSYDTLRDRSQSTSLGRGATYELNRIVDWTVGLKAPVQVAASNLLEIGIQATRNEAGYDFENTQAAAPNGATAAAFVGVLARDTAGTQTSVYAQDRWSIGGRLIVAPGLRVSRFDATDRSYVEPRLSGTYLASDILRFKGSWGRHHQFATRLVREDLLQGNREFWTIADGALVPVAGASQVSGGFAVETAGFLLDVEAYSRRLSDLSMLAPRLASSGEGLDLSQFFYDGSGRAWGVEVLGQKKFGRHTGWVSYTGSKVEHEFPELVSAAFAADQDRTHELKVVDSIRFGPTTATATWIYSTGTPYTEPVGIEEVSRGVGPNGLERVFQQVVAGEKNDVRLPSYHRLDAALLWNLPFGDSGRKTTFSLTLFNIYDRQNVWWPARCFIPVRMRVYITADGTDLDSDGGGIARR